MGDWDGWSEPITFNPFSEAFTQFAPHTGGLYVFLEEMNPDKTYPLIYIGQTSNLHRRLLDYVNGENPCVLRNAKHFSYKLIPNEQIRLNLEKHLIQKYQPKCNIQHK